MSIEVIPKEYGYDPRKYYDFDPKKYDGYDSKKYDKGKRRFDLVDLSTVGAIADVLGFGAQKYGENTWQNLPDGEKRYFAALLRHLEAHQKGDLIDAESGLPHIYHVFTNAYFLTYLYNRGENRE